MLEYEWVKDNLTIVFLDRKRVGKIKLVGDGWRYFPKGSCKSGGDPFKTLEECKVSLEEK